MASSTRAVRRWYRGTAALAHSVVPPSGVASRARGIVIVVAPRLVVSVRARVPWR